MGELRLVATPIGNLSDLSQRAVDALATATRIACEDTRVAGKLLKHLGIDKPLLPFHEHNEIEAADTIVEHILAGETIALISDAGTPAISDPGFRAVRAAHRAKIPVSPVPGPSAPITALSASGLPSHQFLFAGFLPPKAARRRAFFEQHANADYSIILFESKHRILKLLDDANAVLGGRRYACVARELTKLFETIITDTLDNLVARLSTQTAKGEFVIVIAPASFQL